MAKRQRTIGSTASKILKLCDYMYEAQMGGRPATISAATASKLNAAKGATSVQDIVTLMTQLLTIPIG